MRTYGARCPIRNGGGMAGSAANLADCPIWTWLAASVCGQSASRLPWARKIQGCRTEMIRDSDTWRARNKQPWTPREGVSLGDAHSLLVGREIAVPRVLESWRGEAGPARLSRTMGGRIDP